MGKVKIKTLGDETAEQETAAKEAVKREQKDLRSGKGAKVSGIGMKGGERTTSIGVSEEEIAATLDAEGPNDADGNKKKVKDRKKKLTSKRHKENKSLSSKTSVKVDKGIEALRKFKATGFDETVELHINTKEKGISGTVQLPHGTGKTLKIAVADDAIIEEVAAGKINFDILVANPSMMPKLARVAKILGPRGLMPNPKNGTISPNTDEAVKKLSAGQIGFKTESAAPIIHVSVGKLSFEDKKLSDNISTVIGAIGASKIASITLKSSMSPAVRLAVSSK